METTLHQSTVVLGHVPSSSQDRRNGMESMTPNNSIHSNRIEQSVRPWSEVYDELCQEVGHAYGLNDIREA